MKNLKINTTKNSSIFKVAALTILFTVLSYNEAVASVEDMLRNPVIKYSLMGIGFIVIIAFTIVTSFKGDKKGRSSNKSKAISHGNLKRKIAHTVRRGAPIGK